MKKEDGYFIGPHDYGYGKLHIDYEYTDKGNVKLIALDGYKK